MAKFRADTGKKMQIGELHDSFELTASTQKKGTEDDLRQLWIALGTNMRGAESKRGVSVG